MTQRQGFSLVDLILAIGIIATLFGGIFLVYFSIIDAAGNYELRQAAASILAERVELVRNLSYEQVGVVGGIPSGVMQPSEQVDWDGRQFVLSTNVRNIDDAFDGTVTSTPADTAPADYKLVEIVASCPTCARFTPVAITTTVAPRGLESTSQNGSLFINVFDSEGQPVAGASVHIVDASTTPAIDFSDITDGNGRLQLVDVPTSTQSYQVSVSKTGYSSEQTYPAGGTGNPNPVKPNATVASQTVTQLSFSIDRLASVPVSSSDLRCNAQANAPFSVRGSKLIGTAPDVLKYDYSGDTASGGVGTVSLEWDTYTFAYSGNLDLVGTVPLQPAAIAASSTQPFRFVLVPVSHPALQVTVRDSVTGLPVTASVSLTGASSASASTSYATYTEADWGGGYTTASGVVAGAQISLAPAGGPYATSTAGLLESGTIDLGGMPASALHIDWSGQGNGASATPIRLQVAGSNDGTNWSFVGPDGTAGTAYTAPGDLPASVQGKRYLRYRVYLQTDSPFVTPIVSSVSFEFSGPCVPPGQRLFSAIPAGSYTVTVDAPGYAEKSLPVTVGSGWQTVAIDLDPS